MDLMELATPTDLTDPTQLTDLRELRIATSDGFELGARLFAPRSRAVGAVLLVPAMGVPQRFYEPFARWLASRNFRVMTFDYRGTGLSKQGPLAKVDADILTWAQKDTAAVLDELARRAGDEPLTWIGHSLGGQIVPFVPNHTRAAKIITIATGSGYWRHNAAPLRRKVWFFWFGAVPLTTPLFGYFPGRRLGMVGDLPRGVVWQWRRWCMNPDYAVGAEGAEVRTLFAEVATPITSFSFTDDEMMSARSISTIHGHYSGADKTMHRFTPSELGVRKVGHFGFFRPEMEAPIWTRHVYGELARSSSTAM